MNLPLPSSGRVSRAQATAVHPFVVPSIAIPPTHLSRQGFTLQPRIDKSCCSTKGTHFRYETGTRTAGAGTQQS